MKKIILPIVVTASSFVFQMSAQVGVNNTAPAATLDVIAKNPTGTGTTPEGLLIPRVDREKAQSMTGVSPSTMIYVNSVATGAQTGTAANIDAIGYYFYNGTAWVKLGSDGDTSIYTNDGTLATDRTINMAGKKLAFTGATGINSFSISGTGPLGVTHPLTVNGNFGRIGIGTVTPQTSLHVRGTVQIDSNIGLGGTATSPGNTGTTGQVITSNGGGPVSWTTPVNLYDKDGTLSANRTVTMGANSLDFAGTGPVKISSTGGFTLADGSQGANKILVSDANGKATWKTDADVNTNIYNTDGTVLANRTVTQADKTLAFTGTATNAFSVDGTTFSVDAANNRIGMGTNAPTGKLDVVMDNVGSAAGNDIYFNGYGSSAAPSIFLGSARGTAAAPANLANGDAIGGLYFNGRFNNTDSYTSGSAVTSNYRGNGTTQLSDLQFWTSGTQKMTVDANGDVGIGTATPMKKMHVNGALQVTNELNVGGDGATAGSAGTSGQLLASQGSGAAPVWKNVTDINTNIYTNDGTLGANRTVTQADKTLAFTGTATNAFSVDGTTFSVDAANNRIGMGTNAPSGKLEVVMDNVGSAAGNDIYFNGYGTSTAPSIFLGSARGTAAAPANLANGDVIGALYFNGRFNNTNSYTSNSAVTSNYKGNGTTQLSDLQFWTSGTQKMTVDANGKVGIGTSSPGETLSVSDPATVGNTVVASILQPNLSTGDTYLKFGKQFANGDLADIVFHYEGPSSANNRLGFGFHGNIQQLNLRYNGNVGIGTDTPSQKLHVIGNILASGTITPSDIRIKKDIADNHYGLKEISGLRTITYKYKDEKLSKDQKIGFVAQEVKAAMPELVTTANDEMKTLGVNYAEMTVVLTKAVQELQTIVQKQQDEINALKTLLKPKP